MAHEVFDEQQWTDAADRGDAAAVGSLLAAGAPVDARTHGGETALMRASARGHAAVVRLLLERGSDANLRRRDGWTALMLASFFGHAEAARELVSAGADVWAADRNGSTAFRWASSRGHVDVARLLADAESSASVAERARPVERIEHVERVERDAESVMRTRTRAPEAEGAAEKRPAAAAVNVSAPRAEETREARRPAAEVVADKAVEVGAATPPAPPMPAPHAPDAHVSPASSAPPASSTPAPPTSAAPTLHASSAPVPAVSSAPVPPVSAAPVSSASAAPFVLPDFVSAHTETFAAQTGVRREAGAAASARSGGGRSRLRVAAMVGLALLFAAVGALAYKLANTPPAHEAGAQPAETPETPETQPTTLPSGMQAVEPITPAASPLPADANAAQDVVPAMTLGQQPSVPTYFPSSPTDAAPSLPVEATRTRESYPVNQPPARPSGGEPALVNPGQPDRAGDSAGAETRRPQDSGASGPARGDASATRSTRDDEPQRPARPARQSDAPAAPSQTPKGKVVPWP